MSTARSVHVDGEAVAFDGPVPETVEALLAFLVPALEAQGRELASVELDGQLWQPPTSPEAVPQPFTRLDCQTTAITAEPGSPQSIPALDALKESLESFSGAVLISSWAQVIAGMPELRQRIGTGLAQTEQALGSAALQPHAERLSQALGQVMEAVEQQDPGALSDAVADQLLPLLEAIHPRPTPAA